MILLGLGSNLSSSFGDRFQNIDMAVSALEGYGLQIKKKSSYYESLSYPDKKNPKFINIVIEAETHLPPEDLASLLIFIEESLERKRNKKNDPRTCDIDIIDYDKRIIKSTKNQVLTIPHPKMHRRNFVLLPLFEITKTWIHPIKKISIKELVNSLKTKDLKTIKLI